MATNYSDLYNGLVDANLNPTAKKGYCGPEPFHAGESVTVRAYFNLADYATEADDNYVVRVCEVPYLADITIDKIIPATTWVEPEGGVDGRWFVSDDGVNGNTDYIAPTVNDGTETGPYRAIRCRYRNAGLYYTHTAPGPTVAERVTPTVVQATIRCTTGREALTEVSQSAAPAS